MSTAADWLEADSFGFTATTTVVRQRAGRIADPYDPDSFVDDWESPDEIEVSGYFASQSSTEQADPVRDQVVTTKAFVIADPGADVDRGDRIKLGARVWTVEGFAEMDINPFTGWQPTRVCNLKEARG